MKLTTRGRYAVMALADIAAFDKSNPVPLRDISLRSPLFDTTKFTNNIENKLEEIYIESYK